MANRRELMDGLRALGVDAPEIPSEQLSDEAVGGVLRWARDEARRGRAPASGTVANKLMNGGLEGYGEQSTGVQAWWQTTKGRERWLEQNLPDADPIHSENAIVSLTQQKREPCVQSVQMMAALIERQEAEHFEKCRGDIERPRRG